MISICLFLSPLFHSPTRSSIDAPELRRRKRNERQAAMEERIREIKRRQHDAEEAPKKRRSLMIRIAAGVGVIVGLACVIAYTRFG